MARIMLYQYANGQLSCKNNVCLQVMFQTSLFDLRLHLLYMAHSSNTRLQKRSSMISTVKIGKKTSLLSEEITTLNFGGFTLTTFYFFLNQWAALAHWYRYFWRLLFWLLHICFYMYDAQLCDWKQQNCVSTHG